MKLLQSLLLALQNFFAIFFTAAFAFLERSALNVRETWTWLGQLYRGEQDSRKRLFEYYLWHQKEIIFCFLLVFLISGVDKVQHFFSAFAIDIVKGPDNFLTFMLAFVGNGFMIFWLCYVFWHKPKRTTWLESVFGKIEKDKYQDYYQKSGNVWRVSTTAAIPLLLAGAGLAQSIVKQESYESQSNTLLNMIAWVLNSYPLLVLLATSFLFLILIFFLKPHPRHDAPLETNQGMLWRNLILMGISIIVLLLLFWFYNELGGVVKSLSVILLVFLPPTLLTFVLNGFSECMVKSANLIAEGAEIGLKAAKRFKKTYDGLMWTSYLCSGLGLMLLNFKWITTSENFSIVVFPIAMIIFIAVAYYIAIDWLTYNMLPSRFYLLIGTLTLLVWFGPQKHYEIKYKAPPQSNHMERASLETYFLHWFKERMDQKLFADSLSNQIYLVATEGGGSRAGAWTSAVLTELDSTMNGKFQQQCFAISGVSGGSIGTASTLAWWDNARNLNIKPEALYEDGTFRKRYIGRIFKRNYISTSLAGLFFFDGFQQNILFSWLFPDKYSRTDRHQDEESDAVRCALRDLYVKHKKFKDLNPLYLKETDFLSLYYLGNKPEPRIGLPLFFPNTCRVEEGRRGVSSPVLLNTKTESQGPKFPGNPGLLDIIGDKDRTCKAKMRLSLGEVASLSELFPFVNSTVHMGEEVGTFMDGGVYENMGLTTLYEIRAALGVIHKSPDTVVLAKLFPVLAQREAFVSLLQKVSFKLVLIYNTEHLDHYQNPQQDRTMQFLDPITALLQTPFGGHTDYIYHKTKMDFGAEHVVEFPLLLKNDFDNDKKYSRKPSDPIIMSRWLSRYEMNSIMVRAKERVQDRLCYLVHYTAH
ncbi:MAG: hypothetical protein ACKVU0_15305 [Saprospiraceae bacterium]